MKNFLLTLAFVLVSTFTFASNDGVVNPQDDVDTKEVVVKSAETKQVATQASGPCGVYWIKDKDNNIIGIAFMWDCL